MDERQLRVIFEECDVGWVFNDDAANRSNQIIFEMQETARVLHEQVGRPLDPPLEQAILADVTRFKPLVQTFASPMSASIRAMVYCILDGAQVKAIRFDYSFKAHAKLKVDIAYSAGETAFTSDNLWDVEALRHFGLMKMGGAPVIDGYYAFRKGA